ncbi:MAG: ABC transporter ATP-binding protein [Limisphaerales bacterium]|nr:dipeptide/oligopeptide/nickel ABC transporter ATP-binding protein [Pedosphaera sp.]MBL6845056.1 ABC transporter ATP-binding protein [Verrucomicrobiae bacterium]HAR00425.1 dipeptide/oligopeptide/nickel ABC transporter ATP-binding protein [Verrucomicrobiales bacterium]HAW02379.1 dipeptide/oligopeptide/nickel ABC transporter ATP-binding protein [Verrucomicrobiales bacterium]HBP55678.1 dipeptide/oligopeptide/nickel ABC transporter ATP-binding protein [Verrucomicrobiales bacterium]
MSLLKVNDLKTWFHTRSGVVRAVNGVSFSLEKGETLGIVGESGSGKSVACYSLMGLVPKPPGRIESGTAHFDGQDLLSLSENQLNQIRGKRISMIFQDPMTSLNPYLRVEDQLIEPLLVHGMTDKATARKKALNMLEQVGIQGAANRIRMYPHEFSGGMRQRVMIAMALITEPDLLIADEPTTALDVTVQAQILELIKEMQQRMHMGVLFISHDLGVVAGFCDRVNVMYAGRIVESGSTHSIYYKPSHPYNEALQQSIPALQPKGKELFTIEGQPPDLTRPLNGCSFAERCVHAQDECKRGEISLKRLNEGHYTSCRRVQEGDLKIGV